MIVNRIVTPRAETKYSKISKMSEKYLTWIIDEKSFFDSNDKFRYENIHD